MESLSRRLGHPLALKDVSTTPHNCFMLSSFPGSALQPVKKAKLSQYVWVLPCAEANPSSARLCVLTTTARQVCSISLPPSLRRTVATAELPWLSPDIPVT